MLRTICIFCTTVSLFSFIVMSFLHMFNGDELSPVWGLLLTAFGYSCVGLVIFCAFGILSLSPKKSDSDDEQ